MIKKIKKGVWSGLNSLGLGGSVQLYLESALKKYGWFKSYHTKRSVDASGNPLPWYTYPFIIFLEPRIKPTFEVFEYGSGNSTKWYAGKVSSITAVEHETAWVDIVRPMLPGNAEILHRELGDTYIQAVGERKRKYDIIVVDGRKRVKCTMFAADFLTDSGVLILDNSEREFYDDARKFMKDRGFRKLDFYGMAPIVSHETCSTVFYRPGNCLDI
jgi:hypothetical protein